jgi:HSP20 family molecular chaperone IbpA
MFYCRSIMLQAPVDRTTAKVSYNNGTLEIKIPVIPGTSPGGIPAG